MEDIREEFAYLNRLRESGATNMFGAAPYVQEAFGLSRQAARTVLMEWMKWVEESPERVNL